MSELLLIGAAMQDPRIATATNVTPGDFADPAHAAMWEAVCHLAAKGTQPEPTLVCSRMRLTGERAREIGAMLTEAYTTALAFNAEAYAAEILDRAERDRLRMATVRALSMLDADQPAEEVRSVLAAASTSTTDDDEAAGQLQTIGEFVNQTLPPETWIIPDLLAAGDRMMLTGAEGAGKSIVLRQIGMCAAAGVHPFNRRPCRPSTVLVVDAENPLRIMIQKFGGIYDALMAGGYDPDPRLVIRREPAGLDLTTPKGRTMLRSWCRTVSPDLLIIGPIYKLYVPSDARDEVHARQVAAILDELRAEYNCAVLTEHHTPMAQGGHARPIRPVGTGLWLRWPEFGFGIVPEHGTQVEDRQMELVPWRGSRDERDWPKKLQGSGGAPGRLPWIDPSDYGNAWRQPA